MTSAGAALKTGLGVPLHGHAQGTVAGLDYRMLGFQFWLADQFTAVGLEGA